MKCLVVFSALLAVALAKPGLISLAQQGLAYSVPAAVVAPAVTTTQYHAQDELGQYSYGYAGGPSAKQEVRTADGITRGSYSYIDGNGLVQSASYVSDPINGFRVAATNLPQGPVAPAQVALAAAPVAVAAPAVVAGAPLPVQDTPEVIAARAAHFQAVAEAQARSGRKRRDLSALVAQPLIAVRAPNARFAYSVTAPAPLTVAARVAYASPVAAVAPAQIAAVAPARAAVIAAPAAYAAPAAVVAPAVTSTQYHAQDELGQYSYGYAGGPSAKQEVRTADGITRGSYSYIDGNGLVQSASYVSDPVNGFRVAATNLPQGPVAPAAGPIVVAA